MVSLTNAAQTILFFSMTIIFDTTMCLNLIKNLRYNTQGIISKKFCPKNNLYMRMTAHHAKHRLVCL